MDLGSSYFGHWNGDHSAAAGSWFYNQFHKKGALIHNYYAFELEALSNQEQFKQIPDDIFPFYHWLNLGVETEIEHKMNPWSILKTLKD